MLKQRDLRRWAIFALILRLSALLGTVMMGR